LKLVPGAVLIVYACWDKKNDWPSYWNENFGHVTGIRMSKAFNWTPTRQYSLVGLLAYNVAFKGVGHILRGQGTTKKILLGSFESS